jgi:hypothetical protein
VHTLHLAHPEAISYCFFFVIRKIPSKISVITEKFNIEYFKQIILSTNWEEAAMVCSNLGLTLSSLPSNTAFDLTTSHISSPAQTHQWYALYTTPTGKDLSEGDLWIDYNYVEPLMSLPLSESEDPEAYRIRKNTSPGLMLLQSTAGKTESKSYTPAGHFQSLS